jgi:hypothetical protein
MKDPTIKISLVLLQLIARIRRKNQTKPYFGGRPFIPVSAYFEKVPIELRD